MDYVISLYEKYNVLKKIREKLQILSKETKKTIINLSKKQRIELEKIIDDLVKRVY